MRDHPCPVGDCSNKRGGDEVMCPYHWRRVSFHTRDRVWRHYRSAPGSGRHLEAIADAIEEAST